MTDAPPLPDSKNTDRPSAAAEYDAGSPFRLLAAGDRAVTVEFGLTIDAAVNARVRALDAALSADPVPGVIEMIPTYRSLQIIYDPVNLSFDALCDRLDALVASGALEPVATDREGGRRWTVPVAYGGDHGVDLGAASDSLGMTPDDLADHHANTVFTVAMIGFQPGFTYLSGLPEALHLSRMEKPRNVTPAGSVSIGGVQGAISSVEAPSAWRLLGQTPVRPFDLRREDPFLFRPGDHIRFRRIDNAEFDRLAARVEKGETVLTPDADDQDGGGRR